MQYSLSVMGERIPPGSYFQYPPPGVPASPIRSASIPTDRERLVQVLNTSENFDFSIIHLDFVIFVVFFLWAFIEKCKN